MPSAAPRLRLVPDYASSAGEEAIELAAMAGLDLDPWQQDALTAMLGEKADGKWAAFEAGLNLPRQNGKNAVIEARELAGLFLLDERLILHSAHDFATSMEHFRRIRDLIESTPALAKRVAAIRTANGKEGIELKSGQRLQFKARTKGGGRGWSADLVVFDEAMVIPEASHGSILPTLSARPNPQVIYTGSAVDEWVHEHGLVFARVRERAIKGDSGLVYFEWSANAGSPDDDDPEKVSPDLAVDREAWEHANPSLGIRINAEHIAAEQRSMDARTFAVERLGIGAWPKGDGSGDQLITREAWQALEDLASQPRDPVVLAIDASPDRSSASIAVAGQRDDSDFHGELIERRKGMGWVVDRIVELKAAHNPAAIMLDAAGPAGSLVKPLEAKGVEVEIVTAREYAQACGGFYDLVDEGRLHHLGQAELELAVLGAAQRPLGEAWAWKRKGSAADISPLVALTLAVWKVQAESESVYEDRGVLSFG